MNISAERIILQNKFFTSFQTHPQFVNLSADEQAAIVRRVERSCFNASIDEATRCGVAREFSNARFKDIYSAGCMRILHNICVETAFNSYLADGVIGGSIDVTKIADLKNEELNPAASQNERDEITLRQSQKTDLKVSRMYKCKKCDGNETIPIEYQGRAADEASSRSIKCVACGNVWRR
jgi:DNA-directed RNA polymerase subunit M/transcription elongation factor TFIIS